MVKSDGIPLEQRLETLKKELREVEKKLQEGARELERVKAQINELALKDPYH